MTETLNPLL